MKDLVVTQRFRLDMRRVRRTLGATVDDWETLEYALELLQWGAPLPRTFRDHPLKREYAGFREFHLDADWLVIYKAFADRVVLYRTGRHADLFEPFEWKRR